MLLCSSLFHQIRAWMLQGSSNYHPTACSERWGGIECCRWIEAATVRRKSTSMSCWDCRDTSLCLWDGLHLGLGVFPQIVEDHWEGFRLWGEPQKEFSAILSSTTIFFMRHWSLMESPSRFFCWHESSSLNCGLTCPCGSCAWDSAALTGSFLLIFQHCLDLFSNSSTTYWSFLQLFQYPLDPFSCSSSMPWIFSPALSALLGYFLLLFLHPLDLFSCSVSSPWIFSPALPVSHGSLLLLFQQPLDLFSESPASLGSFLQLFQLPMDLFSCFSSTTWIIFSSTTWIIFSCPSRESKECLLHRDLNTMHVNPPIRRSEWQCNLSYSSHDRPSSACQIPLLAGSKGGLLSFQTMDSVSAEASYAMWNCILEFSGLGILMAIGALFTLDNWALVSPDVFPWWSYRGTLRSTSDAYLHSGVKDRWISKKKILKIVCNYHLLVYNTS